MLKRFQVLSNAGLIVTGVAIGMIFSGMPRQAEPRAEAQTRPSLTSLDSRLTDLESRVNQLTTTVEVGFMEIDYLYLPRTGGSVYGELHVGGDLIVEGEISGALRFAASAMPPASPNSVGMTYFNTSAGRVEVADGTSWVPIIDANGGTIDGDLLLGGNLFTGGTITTPRVTGLNPPVNANDAARKSYVDAAP